jgi:hypothetical protein
MSNSQPQSHAAAGVTGTEGDHITHYAPGKGPQPDPTAGVVSGENEHMGVFTPDKTGTETYVSSDTERNGVSAHGNAVLEHDAQTKGRWFQYIKTKQFWITLALGQGTCISKAAQAN